MLLWGDTGILVSDVYRFKEASSTSESILGLLDIMQCIQQQAARCVPLTPPAFAALAGP